MAVSSIAQAPPPRAPENGFQKLAGIPALLWDADVTEPAAHWLATAIASLVEDAVCMSKAERTAKRHGPAHNRRAERTCANCTLSHEEAV